VIDQLLNENQVRELLGGISRPTLYRGIKQDRFPRPVKVGQRRNRWPVSSFRSHTAKKIAPKLWELESLVQCPAEQLTDEMFGRLCQLNNEIRELQRMAAYFDGCYVLPSPPVFANQKGLNDLERHRIRRNIRAHHQLNKNRLAE
jgi:predicted DNA-binding transcriptional regulator AlpA